MKVSLFNYHLPPQLIAQTPLAQRDQARLLELNKKSGQLRHYKFSDLATLLQAGDVLVFNNSKVIPARLLGQKNSGGQVEIFLLKKLTTDSWQCLTSGAKRTDGCQVNFYQRKKIILQATLLQRQPDNTWQVKFNHRGAALSKLINQIGQTPLPPYIKQAAKLPDYQTVYAKTPGSVAAPTAGLHFTPALLKKLKQQGVQEEFVTLHVGLGTFQPVKAQRVEDHLIHSEWASIAPAVAKRLNQAKAAGRRIIAVGTTSARTLEAFSTPSGQLRSGNQNVQIFIYPPYHFKFVDALITNFHLPQSTLLMLVSALTSRQKILKAYRVAIKKKYRFFSFGDAMFIE